MLGIKPSTRCTIITVGCLLVNDQYRGSSGVLRMSLLLVSAGSVIVVGGVCSVVIPASHWYSSTMSWLFVGHRVQFPVRV